MGLFRDWFGDEFEDSWNDFWSDPLGKTYDGAADAWDNVLDVMGISDDDRNKALSVLSGVPVIGDVLTGMDNYNKMDDYLKNTGQTWSDLKYPTLINAGGNNFISATRQGANFVSDNVKKLYSDD